MKLSFAALLLCSTWAIPLYAETLRGKVVGVSDGDTITVLDADKIQYKVRLAGIDAPEKSQAFGERSKQHLGNLVFGKVVYVEWNKTDKYGRTVGKAFNYTPKMLPTATSASRNWILIDLQNWSLTLTTISRAIRRA